MKFKASLTAALRAANHVMVDGCDVEFIGFASKAPPREVRALELSDGTEILCAEQEVEVEWGWATFKDANGAEHEVILRMSRNLSEEDLR
jgi:hypothetical protein